MEIDATHSPGMYRFDIPDTVLAAAGKATLYFQGATNLAPTPVQIQIDAPVALDMAQALPTAPVANSVGEALFLADILGGRFGTAQAGAASTITLDAGASATDGRYVGYGVYLYGGTGGGVRGTGQERTITAYNGTTKVATVAQAWGTNPDNTSKFMLIVQPWANVGIWNGTAVSTPATAGVPDVNVKNVNNVVAATPGASGGILISGTNAGTTTLGALTVSGATALTGAVTASNASNAITGIDVVKIKGTPSAGTAGYVGIDWANINSPTSSQAFTNTTVHTVQTVQTFDAGALRGTDLLYEYGPVVGTAGSQTVTFTPNSTVVTNLSRLVGATVSVGGDSAHRGQSRIITGASASSGNVVLTVDRAWTIAPDDNEPDVVLIWPFGVVVSSTGGITTSSFAGGTTIPRVALADTLTTYTGDTPQTGDSFARIGVAGVGLTNLGDTRIASLDAAVTSRASATVAPSWYTTPVGSSVNVSSINGVAATSVTTVNAVIGTATVGATAAALATAQTGINTLLVGVSLNANQHVIVDSGTVTTLTNLPSIPANWITAAGIADGAIDTATFAAGTTVPRVTLVDTITTYTGDTPQSGDSFSRIGALGAGLTALAPASTALTTATWTNGLAANLTTLAGHDPGSTLASATGVSGVPAAVSAYDIGNGRTVGYYLQGGANKISFAADGLTFTVYDTTDAVALYTGTSTRLATTVGGLRSVDPT